MSSPTPLRSPLEKVLDRLRGLGKSFEAEGDHFVIQCPAHDDHTPSGSLKEVAPRGDVLIHCFAGCSFDQIRHAMGLGDWEFFGMGSTRSGGSGCGSPSAATRRVVNVYSYRDLAGAELFQVVRTDPKGFFQRRPDGHGGYVNGVANVEKVLYRLPEVRAGIESGSTIYVVEGEKDVENVTSLGLVATTSPGGAGKWRASFSEALRGAEVVILPDNDELGRRHAADVARDLQGKAGEVRILTLPGLPEKGDVSDWIVAGGTKEQLMALASSAPEADPSPSEPTAESGQTGIYSISAKELRTREIAPVHFVVDKILPAEGLGLLVGPPKVGKSYLSLDFGVSVATGTPALGALATVRGSVFYLALEDSYARLHRRLGQLQAWPEHLHLGIEMKPLDAGGVDNLRSWLNDHPDTKLVIVDTFGRVRPAAKRSENPYDADVKAVGLLHKVALDYDLSVLAIHHTRKAPSQDPLETVSGTTGITGTADTSMVLRRSRQEHESTLFITGRDVEEQELALDFNNGLWKVLGNAGVVQHNPLRVAILDVILSAPEGLTITAIVNELKERYPDMAGVNYDNVKQRIYDLEKAGAVAQGDRKRWYAATGTKGMPTEPSSVHPPRSGERHQGQERSEGTGGTSGTSGTEGHSSPVRGPGDPFATFIEEVNDDAEMREH